MSQTREPQSTKEPESKFGLKEFDVTLSTGRVVKLRKLTMRENKICDNCGGGSAVDAQYYRLAAMVVSIDGKAVPVSINKAGLDGIIDLFEGDEGDELSVAAFESTKAGADLKKALEKNTSP